MNYSHILNTMKLLKFDNFTYWLKWSHGKMCLRVCFGVGVTGGARAFGCIHSIEVKMIENEDKRITNRKRLDPPHCGDTMRCLYSSSLPKPISICTTVPSELTISIGSLFPISIISSLPVQSILFTFELPIRGLYFNKHYCGLDWQTIVV